MDGWCREVEPSTPESRVLWDGSVAVATLPEEIDVTNADEVREQLLTIVNQGATVLVADMSSSTFCDSAGITALVRAFRRATEGGTKFRLVATGPAVLRVLEVTGVDRLIDVFGSLSEALGSSSPS